MSPSEQVAVLEAMIAVLEEEFRPKKAKLFDEIAPPHEIMDALKAHSEEINALTKKILTLTPENQLIETLAQLEGMLDGSIPVNWGPNPDINGLASNRIGIKIELSRRKRVRANITYVITLIVVAAFSLIAILK